MAMDIPESFLSYDWGSLAAKTRKKIVIDAGHVALGHNGSEFVFGHSLIEPSHTETITFLMGLYLADLLIKLGKQAEVHLCLSDTTKNFASPQQRECFKEKIEMQAEDTIPLSYRSLRQRYPHIKVELSLQTQNSNRFSATMKKLKKSLQQMKTPTSAFSHYGALFLKDHSDDLFGFTHPFLLNTAEEDAKMGGNWWMDESTSIHPADLANCPFLPLKKLGVINLYSKSTGILCPGTYAGLMLAVDPQADRVAIYARQDDETIGEKVLRGILASHVFAPEFNCYSLQIILPLGHAKIEFSHLNFPELKSQISWEVFSQQVEQRNLMERYKIYGEFSYV